MFNPQCFTCCKCLMVGTNSLQELRLGVTLVRTEEKKIWHDVFQCTVVFHRSSMLKCIYTFDTLSATHLCNQKKWPMIIFPFTFKLWEIKSVLKAFHCLKGLLSNYIKSLNTSYWSCVFFKENGIDLFDYINILQLINEKLFLLYFWRCLLYDFSVCVL